MKNEVISSFRNAENVFKNQNDFYHRLYNVIALLETAIPM